jgi:hypothetical protein
MMLPRIDTLHLQLRSHSGGRRSGAAGVPWSHCGSRNCPTLRSFAGTRKRSTAYSTDRRFPLIVVRSRFEFRR